MAGLFKDLVAATFASVNILWAFPTRGLLASAVPSGDGKDIMVFISFPPPSFSVRVGEATDETFDTVTDDWSGCGAC